MPKVLFSADVLQRSLFELDHPRCFQAQTGNHKIHIGAYNADPGLLTSCIMHTYFMNLLLELETYLNVTHTVLTQKLMRP
jgi:hypothetical protein